MAMLAQPLTRLRRRGNPNWGKPMPFAPRSLTEFEVEVKRLRLTKGMYSSSNELHRWCQKNRNRIYIPEWLLEDWDIVVELNFGSI